ncbi:hypothetical protein KCU77_g1173, partial [Aureobasidium melanogenum]
MAAKKQKPRKATKAAKPKSTTTPKTINKKNIAMKAPEAEEGVAISAPRRSTRLAEKSAVKSTAERLRKGFGGPYLKMHELAGAIPWTEATATGKMRLNEYSLAEIADVVFFPDYTNEQVKTIFRKVQALPDDQQKVAFEKAFKAALDQIFAGTFGFHGIYTRSRPDDHVWFWDQALGCWRHWVITGTGHVDETFHLAAPPEVTTTWEAELKRRGHPGLDLRTQPAFHLVDGDDAEEKVKLIDMPLVIVADSDHFTDLDPSRDVEEETELGSLKTSVVDETEYEEKKFDGQTVGPYGNACWDWVFSDFMLKGDDDEYFCQQDGDTYTLTLKKPGSLKGKDAAAWHADVPYGPFAAFARKVDATFWPPTPPPVLNSAGVPQATFGSRQSSPTSAVATPKSPFALASVPITRYRSGQAFDTDRLSRHAAHFGIEAPALADIATHLNVALPAQPSPAIGPSRTTRLNRRTASAMNSPS